MRAGPEFVVGGFTEPQGKRAGLGALLVGYYEGEDFVFAGKIGAGLIVCSASGCSQAPA